ncbi:MAG: TatD family hydrolase [Christensenellales bacterium]
MMTEELIGLFDTHAHPTDERFNEDREQVLAHMREAGMLCMCVGADMASSAQSVALANERLRISMRRSAYIRTTQRISPRRIFRS